MQKRNELLVVQDDWEWDETEARHELKHPFYAECYTIGLRSIFQNALEYEAWKEKNENNIITDERSNIYSFIGKRGSGKTTAMDEFCRILRGMDKDNEYYDWWLERVMPEEQRRALERKRFKFHVLEPIDASLFGEDEDLFEQVMVNIYRYFEDSIGSQRSDIMEIFSGIMRNYYNMRSRNDEKTSDFSIANMINFSADNQSMQKKIANLINKLLICKRERDFEYIVIPIDDLDLNIEHGYQMVEQIQKYFAYHKIIVLISMDYDQMRIVCEQHFSDRLTRINETNGVRIGQKYVCGLSKDIMTKIFHISQRMYMPDFERILKNTYIVTEQKSGKESKVVLQVKPYLFGKIAAHMHIYYDMCGLKQHFAEPVTMREFVVYNELLDSLEYLDFSKKRALLYTNPSTDTENMDILKQYDLNYRRFADDILGRMVQNLLTPVQREAFRNLCLRDLERRAKYFVNSYRKGDEIVFDDIDVETENKELSLNRLIESQNRELEYSYGKLIEHIYRWGRKSWNGYFEDKPYIWCVLASFSTEMTRTYLNYYYNPDQERRKEKYQKRLLAFIGESFGGKWMGEAFPYFKCKSKLEKENEIILRGYADSASKMLVINLDEEGCQKSTFEDWVVKNHYIEIMGVLSMFFSSTDGEKIHGLQYKFEAGSSEEKTQSVPVKVSHFDEARSESSNKVPHISAENDPTLKFDIMTFVLFSLNYKDTRNNIINNITNVLHEIHKWYYSTQKLDKKEIRKLVKERLCELGIYMEKTTKVAFPFYDLDLSYNICKRLRKEFKNGEVQGNLMEALKVYYGKMVELLGKEKEEYEKSCEALQKEDDIYKSLNRDFDYLKNFEECPFINVILKKGIDKEIMDQVEMLIGNLTVDVELYNDAETLQEKNTETVIEGVRKEAKEQS